MMPTAEKRWLVRCRSYPSKATPRSLGSSSAPALRRHRRAAVWPEPQLRRPP